MAATVIVYSPRALAAGLQFCNLMKFCRWRRGSQTGSQRRQDSGDVERLPPAITAAERHIRPQSATPNDQSLGRRRPLCLMLCRALWGDGLGSANSSCESVAR